MPTLEQLDAATPRCISPILIKGTMPRGNRYVECRTPLAWAHDHGVWACTRCHTLYEPGTVRLLVCERVTG